VTTDPSPQVLDDGWGFVDVDGLGRLRDAKLWPGGGRAWDWNETGTRHRPGIQPADLAELLDHDPDVVVLSRGRQLRLETTPEALALLTARNVEVIRGETGAAIGEYNRLAAAGQRVAGLLHSTC
jgi:hypothetical protein